VPLGLVTIFAAFFLLFVYAYPRLFPAIEASRSDHFEKNITDAIARGDIKNALKIARWSATQSHDRNPMAYTMYARALLESGDEDEALRQLSKAVGLTKEPRGPQFSESEPSRKKTRRPHYFSPARFTLAQLDLEHGRSLEAVENFELARAYSVAVDDVDRVRYQAYAANGFWARALTFGEPTDQELDDLDSDDLARIARISEGERNWERVTRVAERLLERQALSAAHFFLGLADLGLGHHEASVAHLDQAVSEGHPRAGYYLGMALTKMDDPASAIQAFLRTASGDLYRPFALVNAVALLPELSDAQQKGLAWTQPELLALLDQEIAGMRKLPQPVLHDDYHLFTLVAHKASNEYLSSGGRFPLLSLWNDGKSSSRRKKPLAWSNSDMEDPHFVVKRFKTLLQLQWVENLVNGESIERLPVGSSVLPGWIDIKRDWFDISTGDAGHIKQDAAGNSFLSLTSPVWLYSIPIAVRHQTGYLLAGHLKDPTNGAVLGWQALGEADNVLSEGGAIQPNGSGAWVSQAVYMRSRLHWDSLRIQLEVGRGAGSVGFDDIMFVEISEPDLATLSNKLDTSG
jgi:tetratricopeptide (TPR) repeat protein